MFQTRSTGHAVGKSLLAGAACAAAAMFFAPGIIIAGAGIVMLGGGAYLHEKLYLEDPVAVAEYRRELYEKPLSALFDAKYSIDALLKIADTNQLLELYQRDIADDHISTAIRRFGLAKLKVLNVRSVVAVDVFRRQSHKELEQRSRNFTEFWHDTQQNVPGLIQAGFVDPDRVKQKFLTEFSWVGTEGQLYHHEEPADGSIVGLQQQQQQQGDNQNNNNTNIAPQPPRLLAGEPIGLVRAFNQYFEFAKNRYNTSPEFFRVVLQSSVYGRRTALPTMIQEGLVQLALTSSNGVPLVPQEFIQSKFLQYLHGFNVHPNNNNKNVNGDLDNRLVSASCNDNVDNNENENENNNNNNNNNNNTSLTLWKAEREVHVKELLENNLLKPNPGLSQLFHRALPCFGLGWDYSFSDNKNNNSKQKEATTLPSGITKENNIVLFCDYWEPIFRKFQHDPSADFIELQYSYLAISAWRRGVDSKKEKSQKNEDAEKLLERTTIQLEEQKKQELAMVVVSNTATDENSDEQLRAKQEEQNAKRKDRVIQRFHSLAFAAQSLRNDTVQRANEEYEKTLKWIHEDFSAQIRGQYPNRNINSGCAQQ